MSIVGIPQRPAISPSDHAQWQPLIRDRCGLEFGETRLTYLSRCLWQRMQQCNLTSYRNYHRRLTFEDPKAAEWLELQELLVNRETSFFRHLPSFDALRHVVLPELIGLRGRERDRALHLWSAGCSTGQEPCSLAICALEAVTQLPETWRLQVVGSDISREGLKIARTARFRSSASKAIPDAFQQRYFQPIETSRGEQMEARASLRSLLRFEPWNLVDPSSYSVSQQDVIFCHNLLVYLRAETRLAAVGELCRRLKPGGYLFLAPGEVVGLRLPRIRPIRLDGCLAYQKLHADQPR